MVSLVFPKRGKPTTTRMHSSRCPPRPHPLFSTQSWYEYSERALWLLLWEGHGSFLINLHPAFSKRAPPNPLNVRLQPSASCKSQTMHLSTPPVHFSSSRLQVLFAAFQLVLKNLLILAWKLRSALKNSPWDQVLQELKALEKHGGILYSLSASLKNAELIICSSSDSINRHLSFSYNHINFVILWHFLNKQIQKAFK